ncbi:[protein-PII] uridylyltransferase [Pseudonocardia sp. HH130630-07]|uniref:[protein-PII] uridylyltransferase n=1 Tax=Pseudonocardia sp. HH130630-07 TaxID=1690815 RepID=UPI0008150777|nr:[protein-PII] uridylyltransferase [Pseudonocardia sp. HH130630-07]ANY08258.1 protein-PII uridylyltransferase [Pseudonocardia sp. HH130630-07]
MSVLGSGEAADLVGAKSLLLAAGGRQHHGPEALRAALVDLHDFWLSSRCATLGFGGTGSGVALVAVGALGRRELCPYSDLDLVLLHDGRSGVDGLAEQLWYPLWDAGLGLDHSVRTPGQAVQVAATDLRAAFGLLEARHIAGDGALVTTVRDAVRQAWRAGIRGRFDEIADTAAERWRRSGDVAHRIEPDLKNGHGGLRDVALIDALATAQLVDRPSAEIAAARTLLLDVRTELHRRSGRARDVLRAQDADEIAAQMDLGDRFDLARALSGGARAVAFGAEVALRQARAALPRRGLAALRRAPVRRPLDSGVVEHAGEVGLARDASAAKDPALVLRVAATAARTGLPVSAGTLTRLADTAPELRAPWPRAALAELLGLLGTGHGMVGVIESLDRTGLWGRLFPEWGAVRDLPPRDRTHVWTVDRHLVEVAAAAARLTTRVSRPDLLLLAALLHDIGKGRDGDHSVVGESLVRQVGERLGLRPPDVALLAAAVRHHLLLPHTATRRDPDDPATVARVLDTLRSAVDGDRAVGVLLELLDALAEADSLGTGPGVWSPWRRTLVQGLAGRCRAALDGRPFVPPGPPDPAYGEMADAVAGDGRPQVRFATTDDVSTVTVALPDRRGALSAVAGVLALHSLQVHTADLTVHPVGAAGTPPGRPAAPAPDAATEPPEPPGPPVSLVRDAVAVLTFAVTPRFGGLPDPALVRSDLVRVLGGSLGLADALARKERDYAPSDPEVERTAPPRVLWFDDEATGAVVLELRGTDRIGLLHHVTAALERCGVDLLWARVETLGSSVVDAFGIGGVAEPAARHRLEREVLTAAARRAVVSRS